MHFYLARLSGIKTQEISKPPQIPSLPLLISITAAATSGFQTIGDIMKSWGNGRKEQEEIFFLSLFFLSFFSMGDFIFHREQDNARASRTFLKRKFGKTLGMRLGKHPSLSIGKQKLIFTIL